MTLQWSTLTQTVSTLRTHLLLLLQPPYQLPPLCKPQNLGVVDVKHKEESLPLLYGLVPHHVELLLAGSVEDIQQTNFLVNN